MTDKKIYICIVFECQECECEWVEYLRKTKKENKKIFFMHCPNCYELRKSIESEEYEEGEM